MKLSALLNYTNKLFYDQNLSDMGNNAYFNLSNYFTPATIWDFKDSGLFDITFIQLNHNPYTTYFKSMVESKQYYSVDIVSLLLDPILNQNLTLFTLGDLVGPITKITTKFAHSIKTASSFKNDFDILFEIFPEYEDDIALFEFLSCDMDGSLYSNISAPDFKLYYPEPFIASPSFVHEEVWFIHILHYQHWLWFFFISLIMLYFITFINVVRWCNPRNKPRRETRGVSRSKCADVITACVPVSWAISIIVSESVDASDYYDGFGTGELVISIRAYQWGWVYYFPKNIDINYDVNPTCSLFAGNSLKYSRSSDSVTNSNSTWEVFKSKKNSKLTSTPASILLSPSDNANILNFINSNSLGISTLQSSSAFKKIQFFSKTNSQELFNANSDFTLKYLKLKSLYLNESDTNNSVSYGTFRQHNHISLGGVQNTNPTFLDKGSISFLKDWNWGMGTTNMGASSENSTSYLLASTDFFTEKIKFFYSQELLKNTCYVPGINNLHNYFDITGVLNSEKQGFTSAKYDKEVISYGRSLVKSSSQKLLSNERNIRELSSVDLLIGGGTDKNNSYENYILNLQTLFPIAHNTTTFSGSNLPNLNFDKFNIDGSTANILFSEGEHVPNHVSNSYWNSLWAQLDVNMGRAVNAEYSSNSGNSFLPSIVDYVDYDFRNWQALELLEDSFWESTYNFFTQDDNIDSLQDFSEYNFYKTGESLFLLNNPKLIPPFNELPYYPSGEDLNTLNSVVTPPFIAPELITNPTLLDSGNFNMFLSDYEFDNLNSFYENNKYLSYVQSPYYINNYNGFIKFIQPASYSQVLNTFRPNLDETLAHFDNFSPINKSYNNLGAVIMHPDFRFSNPLKLRSTAKNSISNYNALQKVFHARLDDGRSNARLRDISNSYLNYAFINEKKPQYESLLGKNKESFFQLTNYNSLLVKNFNNLHTVFNSLNIYFTDIPFWLSTQSDSSRHLWFDWSAKWNSVEVQPASAARYSLLGLPYVSKNFNYSTGVGKDLSGSETYFLRLSKSRKNYMSNWSLTPYFYSRITSWYSNNAIITNLYTQPSVGSLSQGLLFASNYWGIGCTPNITVGSTPTYSLVNTPGRSSWQPNTSLQGYHYNLSTLADILTRREYLYKEYFLNRGYTLNMPSYLLSSPSNPLFRELQEGYALINPTSFTTEVSRDFFYENIKSQQFSLYNSLVQSLNNGLSTAGLNSSVLSNYLFLYVLGVDNNYKTNLNTDLFKNQYRPMKKGVNNMIRLHATGAIAMPIEIRLHILASSKDVIHSWAIPSAGIKIDCVPGFSSHRVAIFLVSGIFWGQCMEICGRFHHWMPIIVYFMKRDLFFLWCTHFIHYSPTQNTFNMSGKQLSNNIKLVSANKNLWLNNSYASL